MSVTNIFIVVARGGSFEESWCNNVCAFATKEEADLEVLRRQELHMRLAELDKLARAAAHWTFIRENQEADEKIDDMPKRPAKQTKKLTDDYQRRMAEWRKKTESATKRNHERQMAVIVKAVEHARQTAISAGATEEELELLGFSDNPNTFGYSFSSDMEFSVEQLELISSI